MNIKRYNINWHDWDVTIEIDHGVCRDQDLHDINNFWSGADDRLADANGNVLTAVLMMLAGRLFAMQIESGWTTQGLIDQFDHVAGRGVEGWPSMGGAFGIKIIGADIITFETFDMTLRQLP